VPRVKQDLRVSRVLKAPQVLVVLQVFKASQVPRVFRV
jgi:hypothetical protein